MTKSISIKLVVVIAIIALLVGYAIACIPRAFTPAAEQYNAIEMAKANLSSVRYFAKLIYSEDRYVDIMEEFDTVLGVLNTYSAEQLDMENDDYSRLLSYTAHTRMIYLKYLEYQYTDADKTQQLIQLNERNNELNQLWADDYKGGYQSNWWTTTSHTDISGLLEVLASDDGIQLLTDMETFCEAEGCDVCYKPYHVN